MTQQKVGGIAALYLAAALAAAMPYFLVVVKYQGATNPVQKMSLLVDHHGSLRVAYLVTYVIFGIVLAALALALYGRLQSRAPVLAQAATAVGLIWSAMLVASGLIFTTGMAAVVELHMMDPGQAISAWRAIEPAAQGLGGAGGELLGGLWVLLVSIAAWRHGGLPRGLNSFGLAVGAAGVLSVVPALTELAYGFGALQIVWFAWLGGVMLRGDATGSA